MVLYLVQHGEAEREEIDPARALTGKGRDDVRKAALFATAAGVGVERIFHSTKLRARQTAEIMGETLRPAAGVAVTDGLAPLDDPAIWAKRLGGLSADTMLIGHLPYLRRLAGLLLCGDAEKPCVAFAMGGIVALERDDAWNWALRWMVVPDLMRE